MAKVPNNPTPRAEGTCADLEYQCSASNDNYSLIGCLFKAVGDTPAEVRKLKMYRADTDYVAFSGLLAGYIRNATFIYNLGSLSTAGNGLGINESLGAEFKGPLYDVFISNRVLLLN